MISLVGHVTAPLGTLSLTLTHQAKLASILSASATDVELQTTSTAPAVELPDGPTPGRALEYSGDQIVSEVMVWIRSGRLIGLEQPWYTDEPPIDWPSTDQVRLS